MASTRDHQQTIVDRIVREPEFAKTLLHEAINLLNNGEMDAAQIILRDLEKAFERIHGFKESLASMPDVGKDEDFNVRAVPNAETLAAMREADRMAKGKQNIVEALAMPEGEGIEFDPNDYQAVIAFDPELEMFRGEFVGLNGGADFYAKDITGLKREGEISLRVFLDACAEDGAEPSR